MPWRPQDLVTTLGTPFHESDFPPGPLSPRRQVQRLLWATCCARAAAAAHWCGTTIGTGLRFCLQSNPASQRETKLPLITPCHKVICPRETLGERCSGVWGRGTGGSGEPGKGDSLNPPGVNGLALSCPNRPRKTPSRPGSRAGV